MKPAPFEYFDPASVGEILDLLQQYGDEAKIMAGGQSLGPLLNMRLSAPQVIIDVNRAQVLDYQREEAGWTVLGALTRQSQLEDDLAFSTQQPLVAESLPYVGHRAIRNRGTVGGSLAHADPAAEWPALVTALDGELVIRRAGQPARTLTADNFFLGSLTTTLEPEEMVVEVRLPPHPSGAGWAFIEFSRRHGDFAMVGVAARLGIDGKGCCTDARLGLIGVGPTPMRARQVEAMLEGEPVDDALFEAVAQQVEGDIDPEGDIHASADYRRHLARVLVARALTKAAARANGGASHG